MKQMQDIQKDEFDNLFRNFSINVRLALQMAKEAHQGQKRTNSNQDYIIHPIRVARNLANLGFSEEHVILGLLHDVIEDCGSEQLKKHYLMEIQSKFGQDIVNDLITLTKVSLSSNGNRAERTKIDIIHYCNGSSRSQEVKICDCLDNLFDITSAAQDKKFAKKYNSEKRLLAEEFKKQGKCDLMLLDLLFKQIEYNESQLNK